MSGLVSPASDPAYQQWSRNQGSTSSSSTGPAGAHEGDWYMYTEATSHSNMEFVLELLPVLSSSTTLEFWYHMYGSNMGTLSVEVSSVGSDHSWVSVWSAAGQQPTIQTPMNGLTPLTTPRQIACPYSSHTCGTKIPMWWS